MGLSEELVHLLGAEITAKVITQLGLDKIPARSFPVPVRCRARHWMNSGEVRIDPELIPELLDSS